MLDHFRKLQERTAELGNHHRKFLRNIDAHRQSLTERLEERGQIDAVHFWSAAADLPAEMGTVAAMGRDEAEKLAFLGAYFALQLLHQNIRAVDVLRLGLAARADRFRLYRDFMLQMGTDLRRLTGSYMHELLDIFLPAAERPEFVICGVGTRADQDDLDLGIVDDGTEKRAPFNLALGRLQREMLRRAIPTHLYLSEHVGEQSFSASIAEYVHLLEREIQDFIIISEMLSAKPIVGSSRLFSRFIREVTGRYYHRPGADNRYHEGYLRGMIGEVRLLALWRLGRGSVNPKEDALRIIKGIVYAQKTVFGLREVNAWELLSRLQLVDPDNREAYEQLERALSFIEAFHFIYQLLEVQEEEIQLGDEQARARLVRVSELMGYRDVGVVPAHDHLLIHYHEHVQEARAAATHLMEDLQKHLQKVSVFADLIRRKGLPAQEGEGEGERNLAVDFVTALRFFRGTRFWDDVLGPLESEDQELLRRFVKDFNALDDERRGAWVQRYAKWGEVAILPLFRLLDVLYRNRRLDGFLKLFHELSAAVIGRMQRYTDIVRRLGMVFQHYPQLVNNLLIGLRDEEKRSFIRLLEGETWSEQGEALRRKLLHCCQLHYVSSHYFKRFFQRIVDKHTEYMEYCDEPERLKVVAKGIFARIESLESFAQKKEELGAYYDLEFFRIGLECLQGASSERTNGEFTEFSDNYLQALFDVCKQEVDQDLGGRVPTRDLLAICSAGGHGRKLAFDDDYDLIILANAEEPQILIYCSRIITRMNREIVRRGTMPHYWFAERFGEYVTTFSQLRTLFASPDEHAFIDMTQLMGSRMIVGSQKFAEDLRRQIIDPFILGHKEQYVRQLATEIRSRHEAVAQGAVSPMNVKETRGGLRDVEMLLLILMARFDLWQPVTLELFQDVGQRLPFWRKDLERLFEAFTTLKRYRDLYRLTVTAEDEMIPGEMGHMSRVLGYAENAEDEEGRRRLVMDYLALTQRTARIVDSLLESLDL